MEPERSTGMRLPSALVASSIWELRTSATASAVPQRDHDQPNAPSHSVLPVGLAIDLPSCFGRSRPG
jgi:hypothetical protein